MPELHSFTLAGTKEVYVFQLQTLFYLVLNITAASQRFNENISTWKKGKTIWLTKKSDDIFANRLIRFQHSFKLIHCHYVLKFSP